MDIRRASERRMDFPCGDISGMSLRGHQWNVLAGTPVVDFLIFFIRFFSFLSLIFNRRGISCLETCEAKADLDKAETECQKARGSLTSIFNDAQLTGHAYRISLPEVWFIRVCLEIQRKSSYGAIFGQVFAVSCARHPTKYSLLLECGEYFGGLSSE